MADDKTNLPEGTDKVIAGASQAGAATGSNGGGDETAISTPALAGDPEGPDRPAIGGGSESGLAGRLRTGRDKVAGQAADKARGLVTQGLERGSEALASVGKLVGDTAIGLDERLGPEYGEYARRAATSIENAANTIASKDPDELIDDTREFVRRSPGIALAGAAIVGFALARLVKTGLTKNDDDDDDGGSRGKRQG